MATRVHKPSIEELERALHVTRECSFKSGDFAKPRVRSVWSDQADKNTSAKIASSSPKIALGSSVPCIGARLSELYEVSCIILEDETSSDLENSLSERTKMFSASR